MDKITRQELLAQAEYEEQFEDLEAGTTTYYFLVSKDLVPFECPEAKLATLSLEFTNTNNPDPKNISVMISPTLEDEYGMLDYDWRDFELTYNEIVKLLEKENASRPYMLISVCEGCIMTERFANHKLASKQMLAELKDAARLEDDRINFSENEYEDEHDEWGYSLEEDCAYVRDGVNHDNYDWRIIKLF